MLNSSVFICLMLGALYRMIYKSAKSFFGNNSLKVSNVKYFQKKCLLFYAFLMHAHKLCRLKIGDF